MFEFIFVPKRPVITIVKILFFVMFIGILAELVIVMFLNASEHRALSHLAIHTVILAIGLMLSFVCLCTLIENELRRRKGYSNFVGIKRFLGIKKYGDSKKLEPIYIETYMSGQLVSVLYLGIGIWALSWFIKSF